MRHWLLLPAVVMLVSSATTDALALYCDTSCSVRTGSGDVTRPCDFTCPGGSTCWTSSATDGCPYQCWNGAAHNGTVCDENADCPLSHPLCWPAGDSNLTICGTAGADDIRVSQNGAAVCGNDGNDSVIMLGAGPLYVNGGDGDDVIPGSLLTDYIMGGPGSDTLGGLAGDNNADYIYGLTASSFGADGDNIISGGPGGDTLIGAAGNDTIYGDDGNDIIVGQAGRDAMRGGNGDDAILSNFLGTTPNDILGDVLCGEAGNDDLIGDGPGHQCMDGGPDQAGPGNDCQYANLPDDTDDHDAGSATNCVSAVKTSTNGTLISPIPNCCH